MRSLLLVMVAAALTACAAAGPAPESVATTTLQEGAPALSHAAPDQEGNPVSAALTPESPDDVICRNQRVTGSRMMRRVCHARWEWEQMETAATETMRDINSIPVPIQP